MSIRLTTNLSTYPMSTKENCSLDYTEIDQGLNLWSEILPMIEKQIVTLTTVAQEMQECPERQKYVDALMKIAVRINDVEDKATTCIKEARTQLKKTKLIDKENGSQRKVHEVSDADDDDENEDQSQMDIDEQIEVPALNMDNLEKLQNRMNKILIKQPESDAFNIDADNRYTEFSECISKMQNNDDEEETGDDELNVVDHIVSNVCPFTQKPFVQPVQNRKCKHKYEKQAVLKYIADKNRQKCPAKCPSAGCNNIINEKELINV